MIEACHPDLSVVRRCALLGISRSGLLYAPVSLNPEDLGVLEGAGVKISMDGRGRVFDNIFVARLWRTVKYEEVYIHDYETVADAETGLAWFFSFYNGERLRQSLGYQAPGKIFSMAEHVSGGPVC